MPIEPNQADQVDRWRLPRRLASGAHGVAAAGAWFFAVTSVLTVAGIFAVQAVNDGSESRIWAIDDADRTFEAFGLTYRAAAGQWIAALEVASVAACLILSTRRRGRRGPARLGHAGLIAWNALWLFNSAWYTALDTHRVTVIVTGGLAVCFLCTVARAVHARCVPDPEPARL